MTEDIDKFDVEREADEEDQKPHRNAESIFDDPDLPSDEDLIESALDL